MPIYLLSRNLKLNAIKERKSYENVMLIVSIYLVFAALDTGCKVPSAHPLCRWIVDMKTRPCEDPVL